MILQDTRSTDVGVLDNIATFRSNRGSILTVQNCLLGAWLRYRRPDTKSVTRIEEPDCSSLRSKCIHELKRNKWWFLSWPTSPRSTWLWWLLSEWPMVQQEPSSIFCRTRYGRVSPAWEWAFLVQWRLYMSGDMFRDVLKNFLITLNTRAHSGRALILK